MKYSYSYQMNLLCISHIQPIAETELNHFNWQMREGANKHARMHHLLPNCFYTFSLLKFTISNFAAVADITLYYMAFCSTLVLARPTQKSKQRRARIQTELRTSRLDVCSCVHTDGPMLTHLCRVSFMLIVDQRLLEY